MSVRLWQPSSAKKTSELGVVVLAGVHERRGEAASARRLDHRGHLHEVGPCPGDDEKVSHRQTSANASSQAEIAEPAANRCSA